MPEPEIRIKIKSTADNKGIDDSRKSLGEYAKEIPGVGRALELLKNPIALVVAGFTSIVVAARAMIQSFSGAQEAAASLDATLANNGLLTEQYRQRLHALAGQLQDTTGIADDQWFPILERLTQYGSRPETVGMDIEAVKNLAGIMKGDLVGAADRLSQAMEGSFEIFRRILPEFKATGDQAKDLKALYEQLAEKGAGLLEARQKTLAGQTRTLANSWDDLKESGGALINQTGILQTGMNWLTTAFQGWTKAMGQSIPTLAGLQNQLGGAKVDTDTLKRSIDDLKTALAESKTALEDEMKVLDKRRAKLNENARAQDEIRNAELAAEKSLVDRAVAEGKLTPEEGMIEKQRIDRSFAAAKQQAEEARMAEEESLAREQLSALTAERARRQQIMIEARRAVPSDDAAAATQAAEVEARRELEARRADMLAAQEGVLNGGSWTGVWDRADLAIAESRRFSGASRRYLETRGNLREQTGARERLAVAEAEFAEFDPMFQERGSALIGELQGIQRQRNTGRRVNALQSQTALNDDVVELIGARGNLVNERESLGADLLRQLQSAGRSELGAVESLGQAILADKAEIVRRFNRIEKEIEDITRVNRDQK